MYGKWDKKISDIFSVFNINPKFLKDMLVIRVKKSDIEYDFLTSKFGLKAICEHLHCSMFKVEIKLVTESGLELVYYNNDMKDDAIDSKILDGINNNFLLDKIKKLGKSNRKATLECKISYYNFKFKNVGEISAFSRVKGNLSYGMHGINGKGVEKIFIPSIDTSETKVLAELETSEKMFKSPFLISFRKILFKIFLLNLNEYVSSNVFFEEDKTIKISFRNSVFFEILKSIKKLSNIQSVKILKQIYQYNGILLSALQINIFCNDCNGAIYVLVNEFESKNMKEFIHYLRRNFKLEYDQEQEMIFDLKFDI